jgi:hypothetical protein
MPMPTGQSNPQTLPPRAYWMDLTAAVPADWWAPLMRLMELSDLRWTEFRTYDLGPPEAAAAEVLARVASDGWLERRVRRFCPGCGREWDPSAGLPGRCPNCPQELAGERDLVREEVFVRSLEADHVAAWIVAVHGMNTAGAWQEAFSWLFGTTWGRSVPVAVYKYGILRVGVLIGRRRRALRKRLREKLAALRAEASKRGIPGLPDVIAHSFGTWLFGHLLEEELNRPREERLRFGRVILLGSILRPDFPWKRYRDEGLVQEVMNHYATRDAVVPWAHLTIADSGPSGRRGFDGEGVLNIRAEGVGHSGLFSLDPVAPGGPRHLVSAYQRLWRPFLTLPPGELAGLPDQSSPAAPWKPLPWPLRGTVFPFIVLPTAAALILLGIIMIAAGLSGVWKAAVIVAAAGLAGSLALLSLAGALVWLRKQT